MKKLDINAKEWFDKVNGNSYYAGQIIIDYGMESQKRIVMPFDYGYGNYYEQEAKAILTEHNYISTGYGENLYTYCKNNGIIFRSNKEKNCKKAELKSLSRSTL